MTPEQLRLALRRLWLGILNVGFWVLMAALGLFWLACDDSHVLAICDLGLIMVAVVVVQAVFDIMGGMRLMPEPRPTVMVFLQRWSPGVFYHTLTLIIIGMVGLVSLRFSGGFSAGIILSTAALALGRQHLLRAMGGVSINEFVRSGEKILTAAVDDPAFTGGIAGLGSHAKILLPAKWMVRLSKQELDAEWIRRRWQIANVLPVASFVLSLIWNLLGAFFGTLAFDLAARPPAEALLGHACWMTLWTFVSLLSLPALSRKAVFAADRAAADTGIDPHDWITHFRELVGEDGSPNAALQAIFYPVPSAEVRLRHLELGQPFPGFVPGNLARSNLYYSWATFTLLGRTVHCNVGRPALWVFPPSA